MSARSAGHSMGSKGQAIASSFGAIAGADAARPRTGAARRNERRLISGIGSAFARVASFVFMEFLQIELVERGPAALLFG